MMDRKRFMKGQLAAEGLMVKSLTAEVIPGFKSCPALLSCVPVGKSLNLSVPQRGPASHLYLGK